MTTATNNTTIPARFASTCLRCNERIEKGSLLEKTVVNGKKVWCHVGCETVESVKKPVKPAPASAYRTNAKDGVKKCPRCSQPIVEGQDLVKWTDGPRVKVRGKSATQWVHADCESAEPVTIETTSSLKELLDGIDFSQIDQQLEEKIQSELTKFRESSADAMAKAAEMILDKSREVARQTIEELAPRRIEVVRPDQSVTKLEGHQHPAFERILKLAMMRKNIFLPGPAGCGKSYVAGQIAKALGLPFYFISCSMGMSEGQITGRLLPMGKDGAFEYVRSDFVKAYEEGGVFLLDEIDASDPNVLVCINAALASSEMSIPNRPENPVAKKHPDFVLIAAANTFGRGADRLYCGRNELDEATLDRFRIGMIPMDYDDGSEYTVTLPGRRPEISQRIKSLSGIEKQLCPNDELRWLLQEYRKRAAEARLERIVSTRFMIDAYQMVSQCDWTIADVETQLFSGWSDDEIAKVR